MPNVMSDQEAITTVALGNRAWTAYSLHVAEDTTKSATCEHHWRTIACDFDTDVIECSRCGSQRARACNFDDE